MSNYRHGMKWSRPYKVWCSMRHRCHNPAAQDYADYGGRGITVCERWKTFMGFWTDMGPTWQQGLTLDRKNNNGNYCPENCRWATAKQQARNRRSNVWIGTPWGRLTVVEASERSGIAVGVLRTRINRKWPLAKLFQESRGYSHL